MNLPPVRVVFFDLGDTLVVSADRTWLPGAKHALADLAARGVRLGVISNTGNLKRDQLTPLLPADFDWAVFGQGLVILSAEVGVEKPDPEIFRRATVAAQIPAGDCLFCTESLTDVLVAQQTGMRTARLRPPPQSDVAALVAALTQAGAVPPPSG